jgi:hypothetical protein
VGRVARIATGFCIAAALIALWRFGWPAALGVLGGGLLIGISFYTLGSGVSALVLAATQGASARGVVQRSLVKLVLRYALLGFLAYVMIARLRLHPIGLLVGASSVAAAAFVEAARFLVKKSS